MATVECSCGCGTLIDCAPSEISKNGLILASPQHKGAYQTECYLQEMCGVHVDVAKTYLESRRASGFKAIKYARTSICPFLLVPERELNHESGTSRAKDHHTLLLWAEDVGYLNAGHNLSPVASFLIGQRSTDIASLLARLYLSSTPRRRFNTSQDRTARKS